MASPSDPLLLLTNILHLQVFDAENGYMIVFGGWANRWFGDINVCKVGREYIDNCTERWFPQL
jgi:hypothetical protein